MLEVDALSVQCRTTICDADPAFDRHLVDVSCELGLTGPIYLIRLCSLLSLFCLGLCPV